MGLLNKLFNKGTQALGDFVSDKVSDAVNDEESSLGEAFRNVKSAVSSVTGQDSYDSRERAGSTQSTECGTKKPRGRRQKEKSFDEKLMPILERAGQYEVRRDISPDELEREFGQEIYVRGGCYSEPDHITYGIYQGGSRILLIRHWVFYSDYARAANRQIRSFCDANGIKVLDFFDYLPNEEDYMEKRITEQLA